MFANYKVDSINISLIEISRRIANSEMEVTLFLMKTGISSLPSASREQIREHVAVKYTEAREAINHTPNPFVITDNFKAECIEISKKYGLGIFD